MTPRRIATLFAALALGACAQLVPTSGSGSSREYVDRTARFGVTIPRGWTETERSAAPTEKLRLRSPGGRGFVAVSVVPLGDTSCRIAIEESLAARSIAFTKTVDRSGRMLAGEVGTVTGEIEEVRGGDSGTLSAFCRDGAAVIAHGLAESSMTSEGRAEMAALIASLRAYDPNPVRATVTAEPTARATPKPPKRKAPPPAPRPRPTVEKRVTPAAAKTAPAAEPTRAPEPTAPAEPEEAVPEDEIVPAR